MKKISVCMILLATFLGRFFKAPATPVSALLLQGGDKPPDEISGGEWTDDFLTWQLGYGQGIDLVAGRLQLKLEEPQHWIQTWTAHFAGGEFYHTEAISDVVWLAPDNLGGYFTTGVYTSTVFDTGKAVDWTFAGWSFSGVPQGISLEFRTGGAPVPDPTWSSWTPPRIIMGEYFCDYTAPSGKTECSSSLRGIPSSRYIQYRLAFDSDDPSQTVAFEDIDLLYGTHPTDGFAWSQVIEPVDLWAWESAVISATIPAGTSLSVDVWGLGENVILADIQDGASLAGIDPQKYFFLQLAVTLTTNDPSITPDLDLWGLRWAVRRQLYLPLTASSR